MDAEIGALGDGGTALGDAPSGVGARTTRVAWPGPRRRTGGCVKGPPNGYSQRVSEPRDDRALSSGLVLGEAQVDGDAVTLAARGELDITSGWQLRRRLLAATDGCRSAVVDLAGVTFMDSAGLGLLVGLAAELRRKDVTLVLRAPSPFVQRVLTVSGMADTFPIDSAEWLPLAGQDGPR